MQRPGQAGRSAMPRPPERGGMCVRWPDCTVSRPWALGLVSLQAPRPSCRPLTAVMQLWPPGGSRPGRGLLKVKPAPAAGGSGLRNPLTSADVP
jgi:hypothetical protein